MNHVPKAIKDLTDSELVKLQKSVSKADFLPIKLLAEKCENNKKEEFVQRRPAGDSTDYYYWGSLQDTMRVHEFYKNLKQYVDDEIANREKVKEDEELRKQLRS